MSLHKEEKTMKIMQVTQSKYSKLGVYLMMLVISLGVSLVLFRVTQVSAGGNVPRTITVTNASTAKIGDLYIYPVGANMDDWKIRSRQHQGGAFYPNMTITAHLHDQATMYNVVAWEYYGSYVVAHVSNVYIDKGDDFRLNWHSFTRVEPSLSPPRWCSLWEEDWYPNCTNG